MVTTSTADRLEARGTSPNYHVYAVRVVARQRLGPSFLRLTLSGAGLRVFGIGGPDQRVKLMLPQQGRTIDDVPTGPDWYPTWQAMPDDIRPTMRTYTVRAYRPENGEVDIDFVLHGSGAGDGGPASEWANGAELGEWVALLGPDRPGTGRMWGCEWLPPATAKRLLLAGDETAVPAVGAILESLPPNAVGIACLEVPTADDRQSLNKPDGVEVRWLVREHAGTSLPHGALLEPAVSESLHALGANGSAPRQEECDEADGEAALLWDVPGVEGDAHADDLYGWLAGEAGMIKRLRRLLVNDAGVPRTAVSFMGYWRQGHRLS